jgi:hypothetical protein
VTSNLRQPVACSVTVLLLLLCAKTTLAATEQEDAARAAARSAGVEGVSALERGDLVTAVDRLSRAYDVVKVPTLGLWYARALVKSGRLVEAAERYGEVTRLEVTEGKLKDQQQAQADAASELAALQRRIPTMTLTVLGATKDCEVSIDGNRLPAKLLGLTTPINPGTHRVQAKQGSLSDEQSVVLNEGDKRSIELKLSASQAVATPIPAPAPAVPAGSEASKQGAAPTSAATSSKGSTQKTIGWITLGLGGVATTAGIVTGILGMSKRSQLDDSQHCIDTTCSSEEHGLLNSYNQMRSLSTVGFVVGAVGLAAGTTLLLTAPKPNEAGMSAWIGVGRVALQGNF